MDLMQDRNTDGHSSTYEQCRVYDTYCHSSTYEQCREYDLREESLPVPCDVVKALDEDSDELLQ